MSTTNRNVPGRPLGKRGPAALGRVLAAKNATFATAP
jgi:hypothetical protein